MSICSRLLVNSALSPREDIILDGRKSNTSFIISSILLSSIFSVSNVSTSIETGFALQ